MKTSDANAAVSLDLNNGSTAAVPLSAPETTVAEEIAVTQDTSSTTGKELYPIL